ncbi:hypothetical protein JEY40_32830 [Bradyrhizobium japonicum]|nr:hypothetical protein JEY40_32830 [Bradyrhizobium japonicum]
MIKAKRRYDGDNVFVSHSAIPDSYPNLCHEHSSAALATQA